jgi:UDP-N-acetylglucosamine acyltransferase
VPRIDPTALIADGAQIADDVEIGPYCIVGPRVELHTGVRLISHVNVAGRTVIGARTVVHPFASLGTAPQSVAYRGEPTQLMIGANCLIREGVTMNIGTKDGAGVTRVGDRGFYMAYSHVAHDCQVGNDVIFANSATLGGHCIIGEHVFIGGLAAVHQFSRVGAHAVISGVCGVRADIIPFGAAAGVVARLRGINLIGMRRRNFSNQTIRTVRAVYRALFLSKGDFAQRLKTAEERAGDEPAAAQILTFVREHRGRPLCMPGKRQTD